MKVLHVTNWYPNRWNPHETPFIKEHFDACAGHVEQQLWHVQVRCEGALFRLHTGDYSKHEHYLILDTRISIWRLQELLTLFLLLLLRIRLGRKWWHAVNVHIAYPLLRFPGLFKWMYGKAVVISEHWSAYRNSFFLPQQSRAAERIRNIFRHGLPVVTVSRALMDDIVRFAGTDDFPQFIVPNVVNPAFFYPAENGSPNEAPVFLMVASWAPIKRPLLAMQAFAELLAEVPNAQLRIVGYGRQWSDMEAFVKERGFEQSIELLGPMSKEAIAGEMRAADCFLHASEYETFSVVCAEALCCGLPVIASQVGGIPEFVHEDNGMLVENSPEAWSEALKAFARGGAVWDRKAISREAGAMFSPEVIGVKLADVYGSAGNR